MENIVWLNKEHYGNYGKRYDISIQTRKKSGKISIIFRNGIDEEITNTDHIRIGLSPTDKNKMYFMASDSKNGWKLKYTSDKTNAKNPSNNKGIQLGDERMVDALRKFEGDYTAEITEDNIIFIDRRNVF